MRTICVITFAVCLVGLQINAQNFEANQGELYAEASEYAPEVGARYGGGHSASHYGGSSNYGNNCECGGEIKLVAKIVQFFFTSK